MDVYDIQCFLRGGKYDENKFREFILHLRNSLIQQNYIDEVREDEWLKTKYCNRKGEQAQLIH